MNTKMRTIPDILASCFTTAGDVGPMTEDERSTFPIVDRVAAAARAGYTGFGIVHADLVEAKAAMGYQSLSDLFAEHGIVHIEVEMLNDWYADGAERKASDRVREDLFEAANALGARHIKIGGDISATPVAWDTFVHEFAALCAEADAVGTRIAFEPMPFGNVADLDTARRLIDEADHPAGGLILDLWHMARGGIANADIADLPGRYLFAVELADADERVVGTLLEDTLHRRRLCGQGAQDVCGFIRAIRATGFDGPWGVEILSTEFRKLDLASQVERSFETTAASLATALAGGPVANR
jgi:sugar phosphate isomerase/epimerase